MKPFIDTTGKEQIFHEKKMINNEKYKNNITIALYPPHVSKHNTNCKKQVILLIIPNGEKWH